tara:strand:+ start:514 stop:663 length:150 start_codon:yes stop_codon:yes gene_type:complete
VHLRPVDDGFAKAFNIIAIYFFWVRHDLGHPLCDREGERERGREGERER